MYNQTKGVNPLRLQWIGWWGGIDPMPLNLTFNSNVMCNIFIYNLANFASARQNARPDTCSAKSRNSTKTTPQSFKTLTEDTGATNQMQSVDAKSEIIRTFELCPVVGDHHPPLVHIHRRRCVDFVHLRHDKRNLTSIRKLLPPVDNTKSFHVS